MGSILVVLAHVFAQYRPKVLLVELDHVVQALSPECADDAFGDRVRTRRPNRRGDGVDPDALGSLAEIAPVDGIPIARQVARTVPHGVAAISWRQTQAAVGLVVTFTCTSSRRPCATKRQHVQPLERWVVTVNRSAAHRW